MSTPRRKVQLQSSDNQRFEVDEVAARQSLTIQGLLDDEAGVIPLPNVAGKALAKVIEFCNFHAAAEETVADGKPSKTPEQVQQWDDDFMRVGQSELFDLILAANYLNIKALLDLTCRAVANMIKGKTPEEIRKHFGITNDFTPEEEDEVCRENQWAFDR